MTVYDLIKRKKEEVRVYRDDFFAEEDDPDWRKNHKLGPVHIQIRCRLCEAIIAKDLKQYGWLENDEYYKKYLVEHLVQKHTS